MAARGKPGLRGYRRCEAGRRAPAGRGKLIAAQETNGYLGTYAPKERFYNKVAKGDPTTWDIWTHAMPFTGCCAIAGLHDDPAALRACEKQPTCWMKTVGPPSGDVTRFGTRHGLSSAVLLESIVMLYRQTGDARYLDFAKHIVGCIERNPDLRIMAAMRAGEDVTALGRRQGIPTYGRSLGLRRTLSLHGREGVSGYGGHGLGEDSADHVNVAGGPWSYQVKRTTNHECFAPPQYFHPTNCVETCSTTTWIQLCLSLFDLTGEARYADAAEVAIVQPASRRAQSPNGNDWAYHSMLNMPNRGYSDAMTCCASSGPRALELYATPPRVRLRRTPGRQ